MKVKRIEIAASILTLSLTVVMSGCSVSINLNNKKKEATESMETTEKKEETPAPTTKECLYCKEQIAMEATRCPHCTSELE